MPNTNIRSFKNISGKYVSFFSKVFNFCRTKCSKAFKKKINPTKKRWTKAYRKTHGKDLAVDKIYEMPQKQTEIQKYTRENFENTRIIFFIPIYSLFICKITSNLKIYQKLKTSKLMMQSSTSEKVTTLPNAWLKALKCKRYWTKKKSRKAFTLFLCLKVIFIIYFYRFRKFYQS